MYKLTGSKRMCCEPLFDEIPMWRAFIGSAFESGYGQLVADSDTNPTTAVLNYGGLVVYAGTHNSAVAQELVRYFKDQPMILGYSNGWNEQIKSAHSDRLRSHKRYYLPPSGQIYEYATRILRQSRLKCVPIEENDFGHLRDSLQWEHHLYHFADVQDFVTNGNGVIIKIDGQIVSGASSFVVSKSHSECQVTTIPSERRKGYGRLASAAYLIKCKEKELITPWDAANEASVKLARTLGYTDVIEYDVFQVS